MIDDVRRVQHEIEYKGYELINNLTRNKMEKEQRDEVMNQ